MRGSKVPRDRRGKHRSSAAAESNNAAKLPEKQNGDLGLHMLSGELLSQEDINCERWYDAAPKWPERSTRSSNTFSILQWQTVADQALFAVVREFEKRMQNNAEARQRSLVREKTTGDKIASLTLMVQESPVHRLSELRVLLDMAQKRIRHQRGLAIDALKDLFVNDLLPSDRRLIALDSRNFDFDRKSLSKRHLAYAKFESELKAIYREFLAVVDDCAKDTVIHFQQKAARVFFDLLAAKPENEKALLGLLVNNLGAPERKVASSALYYLSLLVSKHHPRMKYVVVKEVEQLLRRRNIGLRAQYFAVSFLNQLRLSKTDGSNVAYLLVNVYLDVFGDVVRANGQGAGAKRVKGLEAQEGKLIGALLTGVNRAYPFTNTAENQWNHQEQLELLFQVAHLHSLSSATQALSFLFQVARENSAVSDRFYRALYSKISDVTHASESKQAMFLNLVLKAMKIDVSSKRFKAFSKRLAQAALQSSPGFTAATLLVLTEAANKNHRGLFKSFMQLSEREDDEERFEDADVENIGETSVLTLTMENGVHQPTFEDGYSSAQGSEDEEAESVMLVPKPVSRNLVNDKAPHEAACAEKNAVHGTVFWGSNYEPTKREPLYAHAEQSCLWEAVALCCHYHPSVVAFATQMLSSMDPLKYTGDPLKDFTLGSFLDKFVYRKPKKHVTESLHGRRVSRRANDPVVNTDEFVDRGMAGQINEDEKFYLRFFMANPAKTVSKDASTERKDSWSTPNEDDEHSSVADSEEEAFEAAMRKEMRRLGHGGVLEDGAGTEDGDANSVDEDELHAFHRIFADEMEESSDLDVSAYGAESPQKANAAENIDMEYESDESDGKGHRSAYKDDNRKLSLDSPFAPVSDYMDAVDGRLSDGAEQMDQSSSFVKRRRTFSKGSKRKGKSMSDRRSSRKKRRTVANVT